MIETQKISGEFFTELVLVSLAASALDVERSGESVFRQRRTAFGEISLCISKFRSLTSNFLLFRRSRAEIGKSWEQERMTADRHDVANLASQTYNHY